MKSKIEHCARIIWKDLDNLSFICYRKVQFGIWVIKLKVIHFQKKI